MDQGITLKKPVNHSKKNESTVEHRVNEHKFLSEHVNTPVNIFLISGVKLECRIVGFDDLTLTTTLKNDLRKHQLLYKTAISSITED